jgi:hypothetical protein
MNSGSTVLGRIRQVDLREVWTSEDRHFTPWLAQAENLELLGEAIGIELELEAREKDVGPFRADILCKNSAEEDSWVVIENQLEKTDHRHLGQLVTYASGLQAKTVVWVSPQFCEEHRAAIDWLNRLCRGEVSFFGIEVELWRIGDSAAAPRFNVVARPNEWEATVGDAKAGIDAGEGNQSQQLRLRYWTAFRQFLTDNRSSLRPQKPGRSHAYLFGIGTSRAHTAALLLTREKSISVELVLSNADAKELFQELLSRKDEIESKIGATLEWREMPDNKTSKIEMSTGADGYDERDWPNQFAWLQKSLERFAEVFRSLCAR